MSLIFNFTNENNSKVKIEINDKQLWIHFIPASNAEKDLQEAAFKRDRFNFCVSYMLNQAIEDKIHYEENVDLKKELDGFAVLLQFNQEIDFKLIKSIFVSETFTISYFSEFFSEDNRQEIIHRSGLYFDDQEKIAVENKPQKENISISRYLEQIKNNLHLLNDDADINYRKGKPDYEADRQELEQFILRENAELAKSDIPKKYDSMIEQTNNMLKELDIQLKNSQLNIEKDHTSDKEENEEIISIIESASVQDQTSLCQNLSVELLEKNIKARVPVLIYVTYGNQLKFRQKMKREGYEHYDIYDDIFLVKYRPFVFFENDADLKKRVEGPDRQSLSDEEMNNLFKTMSL